MCSVLFLLPARLSGLCLALALAGCSAGVLAEHPSEAPNAADVLRRADFAPKSPSPVRDASAHDSSSQGLSFFGSPAPAVAAAAAPPGVAVAANGDESALTEAGEGYTLNFDNTPVAAVVKAVLGDTLGLTYVIDPRAQGTVTLSTGRPVPKKQLLFVLESALRANNLTMVREGGGYRVGPANEGAIGPVDRGGEAEAGYGVTVIPLRYVSGTTVSKLLEGFAARPGALRTDPSGSLLVVIGGGAERQAAVETVRSFDADWMRGQSVGLYPVRNSGPEPVVAALEKILDSGEGGLGHGLVKVQAIAQRGAILVVAARPELLRAAQRWIDRLDGFDAEQQSVHVYKVRYGDSKQIAQLLNAMFGAGGAGGADTASNSLAPSSGESPLSATERLTGGRPNNTQAGAEPQPGPGGAAPGQGGGSTSVFGGLQTAALASAMNSAGANGPGGPGGGPKITADVANNAVVVYADAHTYRTIERAMIQLDRPKAQVSIDVTIAEVDLNDNLNYGVQFYLNGRFGALVNSATGQALGTSNVSPAVSDAPPGFNILVGNAATPKAIISALHSVTDVRILSNPSLVVQDNQEASLEVGDQVPVSTGSATVLTTSNTVVNTVDYKNTGIILSVLPRISPDNTVSLDINQEISSVPNNATESLTPTISERKVKSKVAVVSGQMVVLAGLISDEQDKSRSGIPGLTQLPWVGGAFGSTGKSTKRTELIILIRPEVIRNGADASSVAEELRAKMRAGSVPALSIPDALNVGTRAY